MDEVESHGYPRSPTGCVLLLQLSGLQHERWFTRHSRRDQRQCKVGMIRFKAIVAVLLPIAIGDLHLSRTVPTLRAFIGRPAFSLDEGGRP